MSQRSAVGPVGWRYRVEDVMVELTVIVTIPVALRPVPS